MLDSAASKSAAHVFSNLGSFPVAFLGQAAKMFGPSFLSLKPVAPRTTSDRIQASLLFLVLRSGVTALYLATNETYQKFQRVEYMIWL